MKGYVVSHSKYGDSASPDYDNDIDSTLTLQNLESQSVKINVIVLVMEGNDNDDCDDSLTITTADPSLPVICSDATSTFTASLTSAEMSLQFQTNDADVGIGFLLKYTGE